MTSKSSPHAASPSGAQQSGWKHFDELELGERRREADPDDDVLVDELHAVRKVEGRAQREPQVHAVLRRLPRREQVAQRHGVEHTEALNDENDREDVAHLWRE